VQPFAGVHVAAVRLDDDLVVGGQGRQHDPVRLVVVGDVERGSVQGRSVHSGSHQVDPAGRAWGAAGEADCSGTAERAFARFAATVGEVKVHGVGVDIEQCGTLDGLLLGEVGNGHGSPRMSDRDSCGSNHG
jgi:hypothetical protein